MIDYFEKALAGVKRRRRRLTARVTVEVIGGAVTVAATARIIELGKPWWLITIGALVIIGWALQASRTAGQIQDAAYDQDKIENIIRQATEAAGLLRDIGFSAETLRAFTGDAATDTTTDDDPDATPLPAPAAEPEVKS